MIPTAYWWIGRPNFGDLLTPLLMAHFCETEVVWALRESADMIMVGSLLDQMPSDWAGLVAGAGQLHAKFLVDLPRATFLGVRGPLTAFSLGSRGKDLCIGDPGLLANELVQPTKEHVLGIVPHWSDIELEFRPEFKSFDPLIIRPSGDPIEVLRQIGSCRKIVSSSLHGIIVADAFGIPRRTEMAKIFVREGGDYKFRDHAAAVGVPFKVGVTQQAPRYLIQDRQHELYDMLIALGKELKDR